MHVIEKVYQLQYNKLLKYACSLTKDQPAAEDLLQDTILRLLEKKHTLRIGHLPINEILLYVIRAIRNNHRNNGIKASRKKRQIDFAFFEPTTDDTTQKLDYNIQYIVVRQLIEQKFDFRTSSAYIAKYLSPTPYKTEDLALAYGETVRRINSRLEKCRKYLLKNRQKLLSMYDTYKYQS